MAIHTLSIDVETFSDVDLKKCGVYKYAESPDFEILLFGVSVDGGEVTVYDLTSGDTVPEEIIKAGRSRTIPSSSGRTMRPSSVFAFLSGCAETIRSIFPLTA